MFDFPAFPEPAGAMVFSIGRAGDGFIQTTHKPGQITQPVAPGSKQIVNVFQLGFGQICTAQVLMHQQGSGKDTQPAFGDFFIRPVLYLLYIKAPIGADQEIINPVRSLSVDHR